MAAAACSWKVIVWPGARPTGLEKVAQLAPSGASRLPVHPGGGDTTWVMVKSVEGRTMRTLSRVTFRSLNTVTANWVVDPVNTSCGVTETRAADRQGLLPHAADEGVATHTKGKAAATTAITPASPSRRTICSPVPAASSAVLIRSPHEFVVLPSIPAVVEGV